MGSGTFKPGSLPRDPGMMPWGAPGNGQKRGAASSNTPAVTGTGAGSSSATSARSPTTATQQSATGTGAGSSSATGVGRNRGLSERVGAPSGRRADPLSSAEAALQALRENPEDMEAVHALEQALQAIRSRETQSKAKGPKSY
jgi:hypothetical protein